MVANSYGHKSNGLYFILTEAIMEFNATISEVNQHYPFFAPFFSHVMVNFGTIHSFSITGAGT